MELRPERLQQLVREIHQARQEHPDTLFVVGHGSGSFGHVPASQYDTIHGFKNDDSVLGMAIVQDSAAQLNRKVVHAFLEEGVPAVTLAPSNMLVAQQRALKASFTTVFENYLEKGLLPVTYGDVLVDTQQGCTIWSTEEVLAYLARTLVEQSWQVEQIIHVTEVDGVYDQQKVVIPQITAENWTTLQEVLERTKGFDVTGGMGLKVSESLELAAQGITTKIVSGLKRNNVYNALTEKDWYGTEIIA